MEQSGDGGELNNWASDEAQTLILAQSAEIMSAGILECYIHYADYYYPNPKREKNKRLQAELSDMVRSELPIVVWVDKASESDVLKTDSYFLSKVNPYTGKEVRTEEGESAVYVARLHEDGSIYDISPYFTHDQVKVIYRQAKELEAANLTVELS